MKTITEDEAALYDRQIRLWGVEAQKKLLCSRILIINMKGLGAEIAKNLVLSGINSLTLLDSNDVTEEDLKNNFLLSRSSIGKNRAVSCLDALQNLNPLVKVNADTDQFENKDESYFNLNNFDLVCALLDNHTELQRLNSICHKNNVPFISGYVYGLHGYMFVDFVDFNYLIEATKVTEDNGGNNEKKQCDAKCESNSKAEEKLVLIEKSIKFRSLDEFLSSLMKPLEGISPNKLKRLSKTYLIYLLLNLFNEKYARSFLYNNEEDKMSLVKVKNDLFEKMKFNQEILSDSYLLESNFGELSPVNTITGGIIAQEIIKAISRKNEPIDNFFIFDGNQMSGEVMKI